MISNNVWKLCVVLTTIRSAFGTGDELFEEAKHPQETFQLLLPEPFKVSICPKLQMCIFSFV